MAPEAVDSRKVDCPRRELILTGLCLAIVWGRMVLKLRTDWATNPQYEFGLFVPLFIIYLLTRRWAIRPQPEPNLHNGFIFTVAALALFSLLPIRLIQEANPDWRPLNWVHALVVITISMVPFAWIGGTKWIRHFFLPFLLILCVTRSTC